VALGVLASVFYVLDSLNLRREEAAGCSAAPNSSAQQHYALQQPRNAHVAIVSGLDCQVREQIVFSRWPAFD
jgi:hypothetical protein